ncbi:unnamed protein product [Mytilus edulis]|uniref:Uncharacterized protein n=1 Tax=Mytilus edulis TaxID=6550 RepID=A0A8S3QSW3_MYTED|nr:unnamed protein product [Mytilus edulis]
MFVKTEGDIKDNVENGHECFGIVIPDDLLKQYIMKWFDALMKSSSVKKAINENRLFLDITFRNGVRNHMKQLTTEQIASIILTADNDFLNVMFVRTEDDINENDENRYECLGIVIPEDLLKKYIEKWFGILTETYCVKDFFDNCRLLNNVSCRTALRTYMKQQNTDRVALLIRTGNTDFLNTMFVMSNDDIKENAVIRYECFGIVIPDDMLQLYIESWFVETCLGSETECCVDANRLMMNVTFCTALQTFMRNLTTDRVVSSIQAGNKYFLNRMFFMTEKDIENNSGNRHKYFGIVIQDHDPFLLQQYIDRWFNTLTKDDSVNECINANQPLINATCCTALQTFITKLTTERIDSIIQSGSTDFLNRMFVMTEEDIKNSSGNRYERFGIVIPDDPILLQQYIETWIDKLTHSNSVRECITANRPMMNSTFQTAMRTFMSQLDTEEIRTIIQTGSSDFLNTMFVLTENEIVIDADNQFESFGIVIPDDMLQQYTERWLDCMKKVNSVMEFVSANRSSMSVILQSELAAYIK